MKILLTALVMLLGLSNLAWANCGFGPGGYEICPGPGAQDDPNHYATRLPPYTEEWIDLGNAYIVILRTDYGTTVGWTNCINQSGRCDPAIGYQLALANAQAELRKQENYRRSWNW